MTQISTEVTSGGRSASNRSVNAKPPTGELTIPLTDLEGVESMALGFREELFELVGDDNKRLGNMTCTAIGGGDALIMTWGEKKAFVRGRDLFAAWLRQIDPEGAKKLPKSVRYAGS